MFLHYVPVFQYVLCSTVEQEDAGVVHIMINELLMDCVNL